MMIEPRKLGYKDFPASRATADGMKILSFDEEAIYCSVVYNQEYCVREGYPLHMHLLLPSQHERPEKTWPLIVFIQGSAWRKQTLEANLASLSWIARKGYAVAIAEYRPSEVAPFPAQIQDAKTAIRFLRKNAAQYKINPDQVAVWGDSSGGHTAVMTGLTWQEQELDTELLGEYSCRVNGVIDYYAPTDISQMNRAHSTMDHIGPGSPEGMLIGGLNVLENLDKAAPTICMNYVSEQVSIPPILIIHGNKDRLVPFEQSILLYNCLKENAKDAEFYQIQGADHGGPAFWSDETLEIVESFLQKCLS